VTPKNTYFISVFYAFSLLFLSNFFIATPLHADSYTKPTFIIHSDFPKQNVWVKRLLQNAYGVIHKNLYHELATEPERITVIIKKDSRLKSIRGSANFQNNSLNFKSNLWQDDRYRRWILIHELINLLSAHYGSQGYPSDWWSNGRSPFPIYIAWLVLKELRYSDDIYWLKKTYEQKKDHQLYWKLHELYGPELFKNFFYYLKRDQIALNKIGKPWPHPDRLRSLYTMGYLSLSANKNLADMFQKYDIGKRPSDWHKRHKEIKFIPYKITESDITDFIEAMRIMDKAQSLHVKKTFRLGNYQDLLKD
jgi:hypothetical protein